MTPPGLLRAGLGSCLALALFLPAAISAAAEVDREILKQRIETVLAAPEFGSTREDYEFRYTGDGWDWDFDGSDDSSVDPAAGDWLAGLVSGIAALMEGLLWLALAAVIVLIVIYRERLLALLPRRRPREDAAPASVIAGMDLRPESLPDDVTAAARDLLRAGDARGCVGLLYRASLSVLVNRFGLELPASATEGDCLRRILRAPEPERGSYFRELTRVWLDVAYAGRAPEAERIEALCDDWRQHFGATG